VIIKSECQDMPCAFPESKASTHFGAISQVHFKDIRKDDLYICRSFSSRSRLGTTLFVLPGYT
jgi:hypothetical protein